MLLSLWPILGFWGFILAAALNGMLAVWLLHRRENATRANFVLIAALALTSFWGLAGAVEGAASPITLFAESARNMGWLAFMFALVRSGGSGQQPAAIPLLYGLLALLLVAQMALDPLPPALVDDSRLAAAAFTVASLVHVLFIIGALVLVHNLYNASAPAIRWTIRLPVAALAAMWSYDLNLHAVAYLTGLWPEELMAMRGFISAILVPVLLLATWRNRPLKLRLSRTVAFQSLSLVAIGAYLVVIIAVGEVLRLIGGDYARLAQISFVFGLSVAAVALLPSNKFRAWFKVKVSKHFFQHRYDYRAEWMRFTETIGRPSSDSASFYERVIRAVADITESGAGLLLTPDDGGRMQLAARWNWPTAEVPAQACTSSTIPFFQSSGHVVELDIVRKGGDADCDLSALPDWLIAEERAWAVVPLVHFERLAGLLVLARPAYSRTLDWEDFDLLRVVGWQAASYLAEADAQGALYDAQRFEEFNRRFAFVMHDIKNVVSQLGLIARNAERHADNPEFRADMIETLQGSVAKMNKLIARLSQYSRAGNEGRGAIEAVNLVRGLLHKRVWTERVLLFGESRLFLRANAEMLEQVLGHLIQNAIEASPAGAPVTVKLGRDSLNGWIEIADQGDGMSSEFIRSKLFKPFVSSKTDGFGIGAFEARALVEKMAGRIEVESREGVGSRFVVRLPLDTGEDENENTMEKVA